MKVALAADHAGFELKESLKPLLTSLGHEVVDCGAESYEPGDDYPDMCHRAAALVAEDPTQVRAIVIGGSGQGEAIVANRHAGVRAVVYYGPTESKEDSDHAALSILEASRMHNNANVLSLGARFITTPHAHEAVSKWLATEFSGDERHLRRIEKIESL